MAAIYIDGDFDVAKPCSQRRLSAPFPGVSTDLLIEQDFIQFFANFSPLAINTADSGTGAVSGAYLVEETPLQDLGGGVAKWTRVFAKVPSTRSEFESFIYHFPGYSEAYINGVPQDSSGYRRPFDLTVTSRMQYDYFITGSGQTYTTPQAIPTNIRQRYYITAYGPTIPIDGPFLGSATTPTKTAYVSLVSNGTEIIAEDSHLERWKGNIFVRATRYVVAQ